MEPLRQPDVDVLVPLDVVIGGDEHAVGGPDDTAGTHTAAGGDLDDTGAAPLDGRGERVLARDAQRSRALRRPTSADAAGGTLPDRTGRSERSSTTRGFCRKTADSP